MLLKLLMAFLVSGKLMAQPVVHGDEFKQVPAGSGTQFWMTVQTWNEFANSAQQQQLQLTSNYLKKASDMDMTPVEAAPLSLEQISAVVGEQDAEALAEHLSEREMIEDIPTRDSGTVFIIKAQMDLPEGIDLNKINTQSFFSTYQQSDKPHVHAAVSKEFASSYMEPNHWGQQLVKDEGLLFLSSINVGEDYRCANLNQALVIMSGGFLFGSARVYLLSQLKQLASASSLNSIIEPGSVKSFRQDIIHSSLLIKSGVNIASFYQENGKTKVQYYSILVLTSKFSNETFQAALAMMINGITKFGGIKSSESDSRMFRKLFSDEGQDPGETIFEDLVLEGPNPGKCQIGLGQGLPRYYLGLLNQMLNYL